MYYILNNEIYNLFLVLGKKNNLLKNKTKN